MVQVIQQYYRNLIFSGNYLCRTDTYFAEGVVEEVAILPVDWKKRAKRIYEGTDGVTGVCPHPNDLCVAKAIAGREKDSQSSHSNSMSSCNP